MINDLETADATRLERDSEVCIIGAGTAGLFLARLLRLRGVQVLLLEAGSSIPRSSTEMSQHCEQRGTPYRGVESGRCFGLGGTSVLWGGQLIPMTESDFSARPGPGFDAWPIGYSEVARYFPVVREQLGLGSGRLHEEADRTELLERRFPDLRRLGDEFELRLSEWLPFKQRNFAIASAAALENDAGMVVWLNAAVTDMAQAAATSEARIRSITARSRNGRTLVVRASIVVISAGALESTRMLLAFDEASNCSVTREGAPLGRYFADHLSVTCARFICRDWRRYNLAVAPVFRRGIMRTPRLELTAAAQREMQLASAFAHFTFVTGGDTGFDFVRRILRRRQGEDLRLGFSVERLQRVVSDISAMAYWRVIRRRLWIPRHADLLLQVDIEQAPNPESRLFLSSDRDELDRKRLIVDWRIGASDVRTIRKVAELMVAAWRRSPLSATAEVQPTLPEKFESFSSLYDVYHPAGSIRMGSSPANSVVDKNLALWNVPNCFVSSTGVFPSTGSANPGMTHLALTARLAETIVREIRI